ncbi:Pak3 [Bugula neritina]|uniref:non-specific serine/threonine protein kinase n=1 Tax=Bugula neritina TaxID=10212 RepID=A0A7J7KC47_BUGNE|nr:Pak3 [Bugula neritina]
MHKQSRMLANSKSGSDSLKTESSVSPTDSNILELSSDFPNNSSLSSGASFEHLKPLNNPGTGAIKSMLANSTHIFCSLGQSFCQEQPQGICKLPSYNSSDDPGSLSTNSERSRTAEQKGRKKRFICTVKPRNDAMRAIGNIVKKDVDPNERYNLGDKVSEGASGVVYIGRDNVTDEVVAVKQVNLDEQPQLSVIVRELEAMSLLTHTNVIEYKASY